MQPWQVFQGLFKTSQLQPMPHCAWLAGPDHQPIDPITPPGWLAVTVSKPGKTFAAGSSLGSGALHLSDVQQE
jgi:hypothetical protein